MNNQTQKTAKRLAAEFAVIVTGVFVALAAESWWSEREQRQYEREIRQDVLVEFKANIRILNEDIANNEKVTERLSALMDSSGALLFELEAADLLNELNAVMGWGGFDPEMGSAQAFVESGNVATISDRQLRQLMAQWAGLLEMRRRFNLQAVDFGIRELVPVFARAGADDEWSTDERREIYTLLWHQSYLLATVLSNQYELRDAAEQVMGYLQDSQ